MSTSKIIPSIPHGVLLCPQIVSHFPKKIWAAYNQFLHHLVQRPMLNNPIIKLRLCGLIESCDLQLIKGTKNTNFSISVAFGRCQLQLLGSCHRPRACFCCCRSPDTRTRCRYTVTAAFGHRHHTTGALAASRCHFTSCWWDADSCRCSTLLLTVYFIQCVHWRLWLRRCRTSLTHRPTVRLSHVTSSGIRPTEIFKLYP